ncbi:YvcK family protein [Paenibacillus thiaminolyticus]|uniref:Gluconeogenesis factor n=1 Tax=Paenibacillus thiaminolyticus TaxID=49283 RepID=A0AAP9J3K8_PANTH|nr:YvcK family protein [Paenibacillus thiaminolyticus]MCY9537963.1 YvcK family protein [Paenibacillus thiaminolyticus]MCY9605373.1 YvcK family protein [Paenibacillus thiaminolyticus]MCY9606882.1 YvcK family protein [Paenibacillus thiaminolyticus]MCY9612685.1 YvcK family protein [Paenibacillus thiaminolyticus]MCY9620171.1 YvcK family protein [Paenibacillus thiaminolyticus]
MGGGTGLSVMLRGLKEKPLDITAIVTVADDGGSSGILRQELQMPPPGDIRNVLTALADVEPSLSEMLKYRFPNGTGLAGHSLGNLILAAMTDITGDFVAGIRELSRVLAVRGRVLPAANQAIVLNAEMTDGTIVEGESAIPQAGQRIKRVFFEPAQVEALPEAVHALQEADAILVGPGSLYTSIIPTLLVPKLAQAVKESDAVKIFVCNVMTQPGETDNYKVSDHLEAIQQHVGEHLFDYVIVNDGEIPPQVQDRYAEQGARAVHLDLDEVTKRGYKVIADSLVLFRTYLRHDAEKLSHHIYQLVENWMLRKR